MSKLTYRVAQLLAVATGAFLVFIGARFLFAPEVAEASFGIDLAEAGDYSLHYVKGGRDLFCGSAFLLLALARQWRTLGWVLLVAAVIPIVDAYVVYAHHGGWTAATIPHVSAVATCVLAGVLLWRGYTQTASGLPGGTHDGGTSNGEASDGGVVIVDSAAGGAPRTVVEMTVAPGASTPRHYHERFRESFEVVAGRLEVYTDGRWGTLGPGDSASVAARELHAFRNESAVPCRLRVTLAPGDVDFERAMRLYVGLAGDGRAAASGVPSSPLDLAIFVGLNDTHLGGVAKLGEYALAGLRWVSGVIGYERRLLARYL